MFMYINYEISFVPLLHWTPLGVSVKQEEQIWCLNMKSRVENTSNQSLHNEVRLHGPMHIL